MLPRAAVRLLEAEWARSDNKGWYRRLPSTELDGGDLWTVAKHDADDDHEAYVRLTVERDSFGRNVAGEHYREKLDKLQKAVNMVKNIRNYLAIAGLTAELIADAQRQLDANVAIVGETRPEVERLKAIMQSNGDEHWDFPVKGPKESEYAHLPVAL